MKTVKVPAFLHELFGQRISLLELWLTVLFCTGMTLSILILTYGEWQHLSFWQVIIFTILIVDITGGVVANLSFSTNSYYKMNSNRRWIFILIHVQPIIIAWLLGGYYMVSFTVWAFTIGSAFTVNTMINHDGQRTIAIFLSVSGVSMLLLLSEAVPKVLLAVLSLYMFKVIYCFAVDHYAKSENK
ncbi:hypothetical protein [Alkalihalobacillus sp. TS-13]|uniref:hypothetical protein n=1 Tax=Alkalihalobacillus sp. TS-13 TaxID=2842455 RepID=UPI001C87DE12|nr:hypothetical protein [Alkalihalobacillus sp. TS-13]